MLNIKCKCGENMWSSQMPNELEYWVYSDRQMDLMLQDDTLSSIDMCIMSECKAWKCPKCSRLYILDSKTTDVLGVYKPELNSEE